MLCCWSYLLCIPECCVLLSTKGCHVLGVVCCDTNNATSLFAATPRTAMRLFRMIFRLHICCWTTLLLAYTVLIGHCWHHLDTEVTRCCAVSLCISLSPAPLRCASLYISLFFENEEMHLTSQKSVWQSTDSETGACSKYSGMQRAREIQ